MMQNTKIDGNTTSSLQQKKTNSNSSYGNENYVDIQGENMEPPVQTTPWGPYLKNDLFLNTLSLDEI